jgi:hypothetical protein
MHKAGVNGAQCVPNISPAERRKRLMGAVVGAVFALGGLAAMLAAGLAREWRLALFLPLWGAGVAYFQAADST